MAGKTIAPRYLFYMLLAVIAGNLLASILLLSIGVTSNNTPMIFFMGIWFIVFLVLAIIYVPKLIYLEVLADRSIGYGSLFFNRKTELKSIGYIKKLRDPGFQIEISGKKFIMLSFPQNVIHLKDLMDFDQSSETRIASAPESSFS